MTLVVIDTNFVGKGRFSPKQITGLGQRISASGALLLVPEVVVWEWAEHLVSDVRLAKESLNRIEPYSELFSTVGAELTTSVDEAVETISAHIDGQDSFAVSRLHGDDAIRSIRDQILQTGAGETKSGIKTGAADSTVLALIERESRDLAAGQVLILATSDKLMHKIAVQRLSLIHI